jgi:hypothetical protein
MSALRRAVLRTRPRAQLPAGRARRAVVDANQARRFIVDAVVVERHFVEDGERAGQVREAPLVDLDDAFYGGAVPAIQAPAHHAIHVRLHVVGRHEDHLDRESCTSCLLRLVDGNSAPERRLDGKARTLGRAVADETLAFLLRLRPYCDG